MKSVLETVVWVLLVIIMFSLTILSVSAVSVSSEDFDLVITGSWGGVITDDGSNFFVVTEATVGYVTDSGGISFYTLPPFIPSSSSGVGVGGGTGSGGVPSDAVTLEPGIGLFLAEGDTTFPSVSCHVKIESYRLGTREYRYRWWASENLLSGPLDGFAEDNGTLFLSPDQSFVDEKDLDVPGVGEFWCAVQVEDGDGVVLARAVQRVGSRRGFDVGLFLGGLDVGLLMVIGVFLVGLFLLLVWAILHYKRRRKKD